MQTGRFITFEGGEGAGKSTQARHLVDRLRALAIDVVATREPGGSDGGEAIRELLVDGSAERWSATSETLLVYAARRDHIEKVIEPALRRGAWVVCDRFYDSTRAYQGIAGGAPTELIELLERVVVGDLTPNLTIILGVDPEAGLSRAAVRGTGGARFENKARKFHQRLNLAFLDIASREPDRCVVLDGNQSVESLSELVWSEVKNRLLSNAVSA